MGVCNNGEEAGGAAGGPAGAAGGDDSWGVPSRWGCADAGVVQIHWQTLFGFFASANDN